MQGMSAMGRQSRLDTITWLICGVVIWMKIWQIDVWDLLQEQRLERMAIITADPNVGYSDDVSEPEFFGQLPDFSQVGQILIPIWQYTIKKFKKISSLDEDDWPIGWAKIELV